MNMDKKVNRLHFKSDFFHRFLYSLSVPHHRPFLKYYVEELRHGFGNHFIYDYRVIHALECLGAFKKFGRSGWRGRNYPQEREKVPHIVFR